MNGVQESRRHMMGQLAAAFGAALIPHGASSAASAAGARETVLSRISRPTLPYQPGAKEVLGPVLSDRQINTHFSKHHVVYYERLVESLPRLGMADVTLEEAIARSVGKNELRAVYLSAGQLFAHNLYWASLAPALTGTEERSLAQALAARTDETLSRALRSRITRDFGSIDALLRLMAEVAKPFSGSGWLWLVQRPGGELAVYTTNGAQTPLDAGDRALLAVDLWEHGYYLDWTERRGDYVNAVLANLLNWQTASNHFKA